MYKVTVLLDWKPYDFWIWWKPDKTQEWVVMRKGKKSFIYLENENI